MIANGDIPTEPRASKRDDTAATLLLLPARAGSEAVLAAELTALGAHGRSKPAEGGVGFRGRSGAVLSRQPGKPHREPRAVAARRLGLPQRGRHLSARRSACRGASCSIRSSPSASTSRRSASPLNSLDFITLRIKDAVCDRFRADSRVAPERGYRAAGRAHPRFLRSGALHALSRHFGRAAVQARLAARRRAKRRCGRTSPPASSR